MNGPVIVCDIDGVLADLTHRLHYRQEKNFEAFYAACGDDAPILDMIVFIRIVAAAGPFTIMYLTGRPEHVRGITLSWFKKYAVPFKIDSILAMRRDGDRREDQIVKWELFNQWCHPSNVLAIIEDRDEVVEMWRSHGLLCLQPKKGDY